jgi:hypothetical protein
MRVRRGIPSILAFAVVVASIALLLALANRPANAATPLLPNLKALPATDLSLQTGSLCTGAYAIALCFSATTWNNGVGPLELRGGLVTGGNQQQVNQRVFQSDGSFIDYPAGTFVYHPTHFHTHFDEYALYMLESLNPPGTLRSGTKQTFCIIDTSAINLGLPGAPGGPVYTSCSAAEQGLSVGWGDEYPSILPGQSIDATGLPDGNYALTIVVDPNNRIIESNNGDNTNTIVVRLQDGTVSVVPATPTPTPSATPTPTRTATPTPTATRTPTRVRGPRGSHRVKLKRSPSATPAGTATVRRCACSSWPRPRHCAHGSLHTSPRPPHTTQVLGTLMSSDTSAPANAERVGKLSRACP